VVLSLQLQLPHVCRICEPAACGWAHDVEAQLLSLIADSLTKPVGSKLLLYAMLCLSSIRQLLLQLLPLLAVRLRGIALQPNSSVTSSHTPLDVARPLPHLLLLLLLLLLRLLWLLCGLLLLVLLLLLVIWIKLLLLLLLLVQLH
jgi:hypothetical protein